MFEYIKQSRLVYINPFYDPIPNKGKDNILNFDTKNISIWYKYLLRWNSTTRIEEKDFLQRLENFQSDRIQLDNMFWLPSLPALENIPKLILFGGYITDIGDSLVNLTKLNSLSLVQNSRMIQYKFLYREYGLNSIVCGALTQLTSLTLFGTSVSRLPPNFIRYRI